MNNRSDCVIIQQASGDYIPLLQLTVSRHLSYCQMHEMDYWPIFGEARPATIEHFANQMPHYDRVFLINQALEAGYEKVIWLDADCVILGNEDMRAGVPRYGIGALWCEAQWGDPEQYDHFCTGALYVAECGAKVFLATWLYTDEKKHGWVDQHPFNLLTREERFKDVVKPISRHWHAIMPNFLPEDESVPQVVAFHGYGDLEQRLNAMQALFGQHEGQI